MKSFKQFNEQNIPTQTMSGVLPQHPSRTRGGGTDTQAMYPQDREVLQSWQGRPERQRPEIRRIPNNRSILQPSFNREDSQTTATLRSVATALSSRDGSGSEVEAPKNNQLRRPPITPDKKAADQDTQNKLNKVIDVLSKNTGSDSGNVPSS